MYEGKPLVIVVGSSSTGRTPITAGLLRQMLGTHVVVQTAGVLAHEGEGAIPEAQMALEQWGIDISDHRSQPLGPEQRQHAELLLAVDRGTALVLQSELPHDPRVTALPALANMPDVLDPHRMPLGIWIAAARQLREQLAQALPALGRSLGIEACLETDDQTSAAQISMQSALVLPLADATQASNASLSSGTPSTLGQVRTDHIARMLHLLTTAETLPEIVDWSRLRQELVHELQAMAHPSTESSDLAPAAALMIAGKLSYYAEQPGPAVLSQLRQAIERLDVLFDAEVLAILGGELVQI
jgi:protein-tyrosine phosphatase